VNAITNLADAFGRELEAGRFGEVTGNQRLLRVNDLSLPWGGTINTHNNHKWGQNVDVSYKDMNKLQKTWFGNTAGQYLSTVERHDENTDNDHWHCPVYM